MEHLRLPIRREHLYVTGTMIVVGLLFVAGVNAWLHPTEGNILATQSPPALVETLNDGVGAGEEVTGETPVVDGIYYPFTGVVYPHALSPDSDPSLQCVKVPSGGTVFGAATALGESPTEYNDIEQVTVYPVATNGPQPSVWFTTETMPLLILAEVWPGTVVCGK